MQVESLHISQTYRSHRGSRGIVDDHCLSKDPVEAYVLEAVPNQLTRPFLG
jgi:hypothetical protein